MSLSPTPPRPEAQGSNAPVLNDSAVQLAQALAEVEAERLRNTLLAAVAHDFRTPLTTLIGATTSLLEQGHLLDEAQQRALLRHVLAQAQRLHRLSTGLLEMARLDAGAVRLCPEWCPADELVAEGLSALGERLGQHRLQVHASAGDVVWCDPRLLQQVLVNLVDNALRHAPAGSAIHVAVQIDAQLGAQVGAQTWQLRVHDEGPGVTAGLEQAVFDRFFRGPAAADAGEAPGGRPTDTGTGLGLAICAAVARLHGGSIEVAPGPGARFTMRLPQPERAVSGMDGGT